jgi:hypothetical protein
LAEVCSVEVCLNEDRLAKTRTAEVRLDEVRPVKLRADEVLSMEVRPAEIRKSGRFFGPPGIPRIDALPKKFDMLQVGH